MGPGLFCQHYVLDIIPFFWKRNHFSSFRKILNWSSKLSFEPFFLYTLSYIPSIFCISASLFSDLFFFLWPLNLCLPVSQLSQDVHEGSMNHPSGIYLSTAFPNSRTTLWFPAALTVMWFNMFICWLLLTHTWLKVKHSFPWAFYVCWFSSREAINRFPQLDMLISLLSISRG